MNFLQHDTHASIDELKQLLRKTEKLILMGNQVIGKFQESMGVNFKDDYLDNLKNEVNIFEGTKEEIIALIESRSKVLSYIP